MAEYGYVRVSTREQNEARQLAALRKWGIRKRRMVLDKQSGKDFQRPGWMGLMERLQPGDLVFYAKGGTVNHVAIYIGGGQVIHASSPKTGIKISAYNYRTPHKMVRILRD